MKSSFTPVNHNIIAGCINKDRRCQKKLYELVSPVIYTELLEEGFSEKEAGRLLQDVFFEILNSIEHYNTHISFEIWYMEIYEMTLNNYCAGKYN